MFIAPGNRLVGFRPSSRRRRLRRASSVGGRLPPTGRLCGSCAITAWALTWRISIGYSGRSNAYTSNDLTVYHEDFAADALETVLDLESDRMVNSFIAKKDLDSEMTVVRNEFEAGENNPGYIVFERAMSTA